LKSIVVSDQLIEVDHVEPILSVGLTHTTENEVVPLGLTTSLIFTVSPLGYLNLGSLEILLLQVLSMDDGFLE